MNDGQQLQPIALKHFSSLRGEWRVIASHRSSQYLIYPDT